MQVISKHIIMSLNKVKAFIIKLFFIVCSLMFLFCKGKEKSSHSTNINTEKSVNVHNDRVIDSLTLDLNKDGIQDKVEILELGKDSNRLIKVKIGKEGNYRTITTNNNIIACSTCGYQGGDPFTSLDLDEKGFIIHLERVTLHFYYESDKIYLNKMDILMVKQTPEKIEEKHEVYTSDDFGKIRMNEIGGNLRDLVD